jgi:hypothetical protein
LEFDAAAGPALPPIAATASEVTCLYIAYPFLDPVAMMAVVASRSRIAP